MGIYNSIMELVGDTPLVRLANIDYGLGASIYGKLELFNPAGSVKDRVGLYMLERARKQGILKKGTTIVEATAGNTGIGVAFAALNQGYNIIFVVPDKFSVEKQYLMKALGATIINTPREKGMQGAVEKAKQIRVSIPDAISLNQFENPANPLAHYENTGPEIYRDLDGNIDYVVLGAGSGGTFSGILKFLKEKNPAIKGVLADPEGSTIGGGEHHDYNIEGIGNDFIPTTMDIGLIDEVIKINDDEAYGMSRLLAKKEGIFAGTSSGAAVSAAVKLARKVKKGNIVALLPDRGDRYFSSGLYEEEEYGAAKKHIQT